MPLRVWVCFYWFCDCGGGCAVGCCGYGSLRFVVAVVVSDCVSRLRVVTF